MHSESLSNFFIDRLLWATLNLLQDEDENIRVQATLSVQFLNEKEESQKSGQPMQSNIMLKTLFTIHLKYPSYETVFIQWMLEVLTTSTLKESTS